MTATFADEWTKTPVRFSPDGRWLAVIRERRKWFWAMSRDVQIRSADDLREISTFDAGSVSQYAFSPDSTTLATFDSDESVVSLWQIPTDG